MDHKLQVAVKVDMEPRRIKSSCRDDFSEEIRELEWFIDKVAFVGNGYNAVKKFQPDYWTVKISPENPTSVNNLNIFFINHSLHMKKVYAKIKITLKRTTQDKPDLKSQGAWVELKRNTPIGRLCPFQTAHVPLDEFNHAGLLLIECEIMLHFTEENNDDTDLLVSSQLVFESQMNSLFESSKFSDVVLKIGGTDIKAHRNILAARSTYFEAMFSKHFKEAKQQDPIELKDVDVALLRHILVFIYTNKLPSNLDEIIAELMIVADKFALEKLAGICEAKLCSQISIDNCLQLLLVAERCARDILMKRTLSFIESNLKEVMENKEWKKFEDENIKMAYKITQSLLAGN